MVSFAIVDIPLQKPKIDSLFLLPDVRESSSYLTKDSRIGRVFLKGSMLLTIVDPTEPAAPQIKREIRTVCIFRARATGRKNTVEGNLEGCASINNLQN
jgi:hypothetical protein